MAKCKALMASVVKGLTSVNFDLVLLLLLPAVVTDRNWCQSMCSWVRCLNRLHAGKSSQYETS